MAWSGKYDRAFGALRCLRGNDGHAQEELDDFIEHLQQDDPIEHNEMESIWEKCSQLPVLKALIIVFLFKMLEVTSSTCEHVVISVISNNKWTPLPDSVNNIFSAIVVLFLLMAASRRSVFITAGAITAASIFFCGFYLQYNEVELDMVFIVRWIVSLVYHSSRTAFDMAMILVIAELLPTRVRGSVSAYIFASFFLIVIWTRFVYVPSSLIVIWPVLTAPGTYIALSLLTMVATASIYMWLPETKYKTLFDIEDECKAYRWIYGKRSDRQTVNLDDMENAN